MERKLVVTQNITLDGAVEMLDNWFDPAGIVATGSIQLCHTLLAAGLVDEVRPFTFPAIQGKRRRFFPENLPAPKASLLEARTFVGVTYSAYALKTADRAAAPHAADRR